MAARKRKLPSIPKLISKDPALSRFGAAIHELLDVWQGNTELGTKVVTFDDLVNTGAFTFAPGATGTSAAPVIYDDPIEVVIDLTPPSQVTGVVVSGTMSSIFLEWTANTDSVTAYYEVWRNEASTLDGNEYLIGTSVAPVFTDAVGDTTKTYYYWVRAVSNAEIVGPYNVTNGDVGVTGSVGLTNFASGLTPVEILGTLPTSGNFEGRQVLYTVDNKLYRYVGGAWTKSVDGGDITNSSITTGAIAAGAIQASQIDAGAITADKIAAGEVSADKISVTYLAAINTNLGAISGGSININSKFIVDSNGNVTISSATSGARLVIQSSVIKVYDENDNLRVQLGDLTA